MLYLLEALHGRVLQIGLKRYWPGCNGWLCSLISTQINLELKNVKCFNLQHFSAPLSTDQPSTGCHFMRSLKYNKGLSLDFFTRKRRNVSLFSIFKRKIFTPEGVVMK